MPFSRGDHARPLKEAFIPKAAAEGYVFDRLDGEGTQVTFVPVVPGSRMSFRTPTEPRQAPAAKPLPKGQHIVLLAAACGSDTTCQCVNNAIFTHDSSWATAGVGKRANNPCNMRPPVSWKPAVPMGKISSVNGTFAKFNSLNDGVKACVELWQRRYRHLPPAEQVRIWAGGGGNRSYRNAVSSCYL